MTERDLAREVRRALASPRRVADALGLKVHDDCGSYVLVLCPVHAEKTGSCSIHKRDGGVGVKCWGCKWTGDLLTLVAAVYGLEGRFRETLASACELAGMAAEADELRGGKPAPKRRAVPLPPPEPARDYPPASEVALLWSACVPVTEDAEVSGLLRGREIDPAAVARTGSAAALHPLTHGSSVPSWAKFKGRQPSARAWTATGHRLILPVFDYAGEMRSVRAWLVNGAEGMPKRVPPVGHKASGLVLANASAQRWLRGNARPRRIVVVEGEPDFLARSILSPSEAVLGVMSGSWHSGFAERVPYGSDVIVRTHIDDAGERYAGEVIETVRGRAVVSRLEPELLA
jgi:hypothetical protein